MIRIMLSGCCGMLGRAISDAILRDPGCEVAAGIDLRQNPMADYPIFAKPSDCNVAVDVIIDSSHPSALDGLLAYAKSVKIPIVIATTGLSPEQVDLIRVTAQSVPVFFTANLSLGVTLMRELVKKAAAVLGDGFDIEIVERHHNQKVDAPSGTALALADAIAENGDYEYVYDRHSVRQKRGKKEIGLHAVRGGTIVGDHEVIFAGTDEVLTVSHSAYSKNVFATGAVRAAQFLVRQFPGLYGMSHLVE